MTDSVLRCVCVRCGAPASRAFIRAEPLPRLRYRCPDCPSPSSGGYAWREVSLEEASVYEIMSS